MRSVRAVLPLYVAAWCVLAGLGGCGTLERIINRVEKPTVRLAGGSLSSLSLDGATVQLEVDITNPYTVPLPIAAVDLGLSSRANTIVTGRLEEPATIEPKETARITVPVGVTFAELLRALSDVRPGEVLPYETQATVRLNAPGIGPLSFPLAHRGDLPIPTAPSISVERVQFEELTLSNAAATVRIAVSNPNTFAAAFEEFGYALELAGVEVGHGSIAQPVSLPARGGGVIDLPLRFSPRELGLALFQTLMSGEASYRLHGGIDVRTPFGSLDMPYDRSGAAALVR